MYDYTTLDAKDILTLLHQIEAGDVMITPLSDPVKKAMGTTEYITNTGWSFKVLHTGGEWDYLDSMVSVDGKEAHPCDIRAMPIVWGYTPPTSTQEKCYQLVHIPKSEPEVPDGGEPNIHRESPHIWYNRTTGAMQCAQCSLRTYYISGDALALAFYLRVKRFAQQHYYSCYLSQKLSGRS